MENVVKVGLGCVGKRTIVWFVEAWAGSEGKVESDGVSFSEKLFCGGMIKEEAVGD
jgi:hypothetical protein